MSKSTPLNDLKPVSTQPLPEEPSDDVVQDVLQSISTASYGPAPPDEPIIQQQLSPTAQPANLFETLSNDINIKLAFICAAVFITAYQIPLQKVLTNYISLDKFPFAEPIVKGIFVGLVFYVLAKAIIAN